MKRLQKPAGMPQLSENMEVDASFLRGVNRSVSEPEPTTTTRDSMSNGVADGGGGDDVTVDEESEKSETESEAHVHPSLPNSFLKKMGLWRSFSDESQSSRSVTCHFQRRKPEQQVRDVSRSVMKAKTKGQ